MKQQASERQGARRRVEDVDEPATRAVAPGKQTRVELLEDEPAAGPPVRGGASARAARAARAAGWPADASLQAAMGMGSAETEAEAEASADEARQREQAVQYLLVHSAAVARAVVGMLRAQARSWPAPGPSAQWLEVAHFSQQVAARLAPVVRDDAEALFGLVSPASPAQAYRRHVGGASLRTWAPGFGEAIAMQVRQAVVASLARLGAQIEAAVAVRGVLRRDQVQAAHPMDSYVRAALLRPGVLEVAIEEASEGMSDGAAAQAPRVEVRWLGRRDRSLWNYVEAKPASASAAQVAAALWGGPEHSRMAFTLTRHGPLFEVAPRYARELIARRFPGEPVAAGERGRGTALASSPMAEEVALGQVRGSGALEVPTLPQLLKLHTELGAMLERLRDAVEPLGLQGELAPAFTFHARSFAQVAQAEDAERARWLRLWHAQHLQLQRIVAELAPHLAAALEAKSQRWSQVVVQEAQANRAIAERSAQLRKIGLPARAAAGALPRRADLSARQRAKSADARDPARARVQAYVRAAAISHLAASTAGELARLAVAQRSAVVDAATDTLIGLEQASTQPGAGAGPSAERAELALRGQLDRAVLGKPAAGLAEAQLEAEEEALRSRLRSAELALSELSLSVEAADGEPAELVAKQLHGKFRRLGPLVDSVQLGLWEVKRAWQRAEQAYPRPSVVADEQEAARVELAARAAGLAAAQQEFSRLAGDRDLATFVQQSQRIVASQHFRAGVARLGGVLLLTVVSGGAAAALGAAAARSILLAARTASLAGTGLRAAQVVAFSAEVAINASLNSLVQLALSGPAHGYGWTMLENTLMELATRGLARALAAPLGELRKLESQALFDGHRLRELATAERAASRAGRELPLGHVLERGALTTAAGERTGWFAAQLSIEVVMGMAAQWAAQRLVRTVRVEGESVEDDLALAVLQQGAAVMLGKRLAGLHGAWQQRKAELERKPGFSEQPTARELLQRRARFFEDAMALSESLSPEVTAGPRLLAEHAELVRLEREVVRTLGEEPPAARAAEEAARGPRAASGAPKRPLGLFGDDTRALAAAMHLPPLPGYLDVFVHGDGEHFLVVRKDGDFELTAHQFYEYLRKQGVAGRPLRLISCSSGKYVDGLAQRLADAYGVVVLAPTEDVWTLPTGEIGVGPLPGQRTGKWEHFWPRKSGAKVRELSLVERERLARGPEQDFDEPIAVREPVRDERATIAGASPQTLEALSKEVGAPVVRSAALEDGVKVMVRRERRLLGFDLVVTEVQVGERALLSDVRLHRDTVEEVQRYNGAVGALRDLSQRLWPRGSGPRYPRGSRGHLVELELRKLDVLLQDRKSAQHVEQVDPHTLRHEVEFLQGRRAFYEEVLRSVDETTHEVADGASLERPDTGEVTREALAHGYRLPGAEEGAQAQWYYYRSSVRNPGQYELAVKPSAPLDAPRFRARVVGDEFIRLVPVEPPPAELAVEVPHTWSPVDAVTHLRKQASFAPYLEMLERTGVASRAVIDGTIRQRFNLLGLSGKRRLTSDVRRDVREAFHERLMAYLCDPSLDAKASWSRMRAAVADLSPSERGGLVEAWALRQRPDVMSHVRVNVLRQSGYSEGKIERRVVDAVEGRTAIEVKDVTGPIDREQFGAYLDMLRTPDDGGQPLFDKVKYVFTHPEGAKANLELFARAMSEREVAGKLLIEVFDHSGTSHLVTSSRDARGVLASLQVQQ